MRRAVLLLLAIVLPVHAASKAELHAWLDEALQAAAEVPAEHRRTVAYSLERGESREDRLKSALFKIALRPSGPGWFDFVAAMKLPPEDASGTQREYEARVSAAYEFLDGIYRARAGTDNTVALQWQQGLAEMLFATGRFDEALRLEREVVLREPDAYRVILLAMMEKVAGNDEPFARIRKDCPQPKFEHEGTGAQYCTTVINSVARRLLGTLEPERVPAAIHPMLTGGVDWKERMHGFEILRGSAGNDVKPQLEAILASSDAPSWAKDDALFALVRFASQSQDSGRAASLMDCWFRRAGISFAPATAETWQKIAAMPNDPEKDVRPDSSACYRHHDPDEPVSTECILFGLQTKLFGALNDTPGKRAVLEELATFVAESGQGLGYLAFLLEEMMGIARDGEVLRYTATLQTSARSEEDTAAAVRKQTTRQAPLAPWEPGKTPRRAPAANCP